MKVARHIFEFASAQGCRRLTASEYSDHHRATARPTLDTFTIVQRPQTPTTPREEVVPADIQSSSSVKARVLCTARSVPAREDGRRGSH